ncbi:MAG: MFS transporter [Salaquimonas sp.]|nr:MFS transporter [Salaquimonas sp.]
MARQFIPILALFMSTAFLLAGGGVQWILLPIRSQMEGFSTDAIGLIGAGWAIGFTSGCIIVPRMVRRVGHIRSFGSLSAMLAIAILVSAMIVQPSAWFVLRIVAGLCFSGSYMIIESWINERVTNETRGAIFSVYLIITQLAMIAGQYVIVIAAPGTEKPFMIAAILFALAILPTALSKSPSPEPLEQVKLDLKGLYINSPAALIGVFLAGGIAGSWQNFAPVFGTMSGMSNTAIATMLSLAILGSAAFQYPFGWLSDRIDRRLVMIGIGAVGGIIVTGTGFMPVDSKAPGIVFYLLMAMTGAFIYPIYAILVAHANDHAAPEEYIHVSSGLLIVYGTGTMAGPIISARVIQWFGPGGMFITIAAMNLAIAAYAAWRLTRRPAPPEEEAMEFQTFAPATAQTPQSYTLAPAAEAAEEAAEAAAEETGEQTQQPEDEATVAGT